MIIFLRQQRISNIYFTQGNSDDYGIGKITEGILTVEHVSGNHYTCVYDYSDKTALLIQKQLDNL